MISGSVAVILGLSKEKEAISLGEDWELDNIRSSLPSSDDGNLQNTEDTDIQIEASHADDPNLLEEEYPCGARELATMVILTDPEHGPFRPMIERTRGALKENPFVKTEF